MITSPPSSLPRPVAASSACQRPPSPPTRCDAPVVLTYTDGSPPPSPECQAVALRSPVRDAPSTVLDTTSIHETMALPRHTHSSTTDATILAYLRQRAIQTPDRVCYLFVDDDGNEVRSLTYANVDAEARRIASVLQHQSKTSSFTPGDRVLLCFPPGADFTVAFWGCLYAGAIACAVHPPDPHFLSRDIVRFQRMVDETGASLVLTNTLYRRQSQRSTLSARLRTRRGVEWPKHLHWICTDTTQSILSKPTFHATYYTSVSDRDVAYLQYTSGVTGDAKPVVVTHGNLLAQAKRWATAQEGDTVLSWLPPCDSNGLVGFNLAPVYAGARSVQMPPAGFFKTPSLWMALCSKYKASMTCAPNSGYRAAATKTPDAVAAGIDLSALRHALVIGDAIRGDCLKQFAKRFAVAGFRPHQLHCAYGTAETTTLLCGYDANDRSAPRSLLVDKHLLETEGRVQLLRADDPRRVSGSGTQLLMACGRPFPGVALCIVDTTARKALPEGYVGEIWVRSDGVGDGYWQQWDRTRRQFQATLATDAAHYYRTSDTGFLHNGELFFYARRDEIAIVDGRRLRLPAIERSVEAASAHISYDGVFAFGFADTIVVVAELDDVWPSNDGKATLGAIAKAIFRHLTADHGVAHMKAILVAPASLPRTASGLLLRAAAKKQLELHLLPKQFVAYNHNPEAHLRESFCASTSRFSFNAQRQVT
ncbi:hypothetical protein SPRG_13280 [Saprolegnia parasitica CBS 223.65]|uniref:AMP-dependent synthetase/ligase domain-containing protein n=1 Tax=Saprolegnia parasitica (strain CBS 223.65) TaxID=695850 RepID=A0A067BSU4_SAPPC|nr:hypothetical protein SPRG_13280 [Saprolegnia parasitica CBS 223.65]KDO21594.1 hypothetical protein SPRG_13280 [Saprolegnia parasitica CBS 223.65]|eukprot:XP_012207685.1 hypothetical protein SPRG_13280 [Saprolegnia parasitica CBS 223.65]